MNHPEKKQSVTVRISNLGREFKAAKGSLLSEALIEAEYPLAAYCSGRGVCGKCLVRIESGSLSPPSELEIRLIEERGQDDSFRLSCLYSLQTDVTIELPADSLIQNIHPLETSPENTFPLLSGIQQYILTLPLELEPSTAHFILLLKNNWPDLSIPQTFISSLNESGLSASRTAAAVLFHNDELIALESGNTTNCFYGIAFDIGTTTVVAEMFDLTDGKSLGTASSVNGQVRFGADVISRLSHALREEKGGLELQKSIIMTLNSLIRSLCERNGCSPRSIYAAAAAGNTAMNHLLLDVSVSKLAVSPFEAVFLSHPPVRALDLGLDLCPGAPVFIAPNIRSFVGGDVAAGLTVTGFLDRKGTHLYVDLGTNGEIVLKSGDVLTATSTAAGPAFEGTNISSGSLALPGAVHKVDWKENRLQIFTIGGEEARSICGTGLIDLLAVLLNKGFLLPDGRTADGTDVALAPGLSVTRKDIRELQLAVGAVRTGIRILLRRRSLDIKDIDSIQLAGAFGSHLNAVNAITIGLLPHVDPDIITYLGNASLAGARALLLSSEARRVMNERMSGVSFLSLADDPDFQDIFLDSLEFKSYRTF